MDVFFFSIVFFLPLVAVKAVVCPVKDSCHHLNRHISQKLSLRRPPISLLLLAAGTFSNQCNLSGVSPPPPERIKRLHTQQKKKINQIKNITHPSCMSVLSHPSLGSQLSLQTETLAWCFEPRYPLPVFANSQMRLFFGRSDVDLQIGRVLVSMTRKPH